MINEVGFPDVYIDKITLQNDECGKLLVDIRLRIKIISENDLFLKRINFLKTAERIQEKLNELVQINILQVTDENLFSTLTLSKELVYAAAFDKFEEINLPLFIKRVMEKKGVIETNVLSLQSTSEVNNSIRNSINNLTKKEEIRDIVLTKDYARYRENLESGEKALNIYFNKRMILEKSPQHLSFFVVADYNENRLANSIEPEKRPEDIKVSADLVINNRRIVSHTYAYFTNDGNIWTGDYFQDPNGVWRVGKSGDYIEALSGRIEMPEVLEQRVFYNDKIQDFRNIAEPTFIGVNDKKTILDEVLLNELSQVRRKTYIKPRNIFPVLFAGKTGDGVAFKVDPERLLEKHSKFYRFLKEIGQSTLLDDFQITRGVKIYRKRVQKTFFKSTVGQGTEEQNLQQQVEDFTNNEKPLYLESISRTSNFSKRILVFKVTDSELLSTTIGDYCYGIELLIEDPYTKIFETKLQQLKNYLPDLIKYSIDSNISSFGSMEGHYDSDLNEMTETFKTKYAFGTEIRTNVIESANVFLDNLAFINNTSFGLVPTRKVYRMLRPESANPGSINQFLKLYQDLIKRYEDILEQMKPLSFYEEKIYFNREINVVSAGGNLRGLSGLESADNLIQNNFRSALDVIAREFNITVETNEENISNSEVQLQTELLQQGATQKFAEDLRTVADEARVRSVAGSSTSRVKGSLQVYKKNISQALTTTEDTIDVYFPSRPIINQEEIDKKQQRLTDIARRNNTSESTSNIDRSEQDTPDKEKCSNVQVSSDTLKDMQSNVIKKFRF